MWIRLRAESRSRLKAWLALALGAGVAAGLVVALAAGAERTSTAYPRFLRKTNSADAYVAPGFAFGGDESLDLGRIERLPQVAAAERTAVLAVIVRSRRGQHAVSRWTGRRAVQRADRRPLARYDRPPEARAGADARPPPPGRGPPRLQGGGRPRGGRGDAITFRVLAHHTLWHSTQWVLTADPRKVGGGALVTVRVVGISANARADLDGGIVHLSPAFYRVHGGPALGAWLFEMETRLRRGAADLKAFEAGVHRIAGGRRYGFFERSAAGRRSSAPLRCSRAR